MIVKVKIKIILLININNSPKKLNNKEKNKEVIHTITTSHRKFIGNINQNDSSGVSALLRNNINDIQTIINKKENTPVISLTKENNNKDKYSYYFNYKDNNENIINNLNINNPNNAIYTKYNNLYGNKKERISRTKSANKINNNYNDADPDNNYNNSNIKNFPSESNFVNNKKIKEIEKNLINLEKQRNIYLEEYSKLPEHPKTKKDLNDKRKLKKIIDELNTNINIYANQENKFYK